MFKSVLAVVGGFVAVVAVVFVLNTVDFASYKFWAPKYADAQRQVFENTHAYVAGNTSELRDLVFEYNRETNEAQKSVIAAQIRKVSADLDLSKYPADLTAEIRVISASR